jgi:hypothetical protein
MEVQFGKGVSGFIGNAIGQKEAIDNEAKDKIKEYWRDEKEYETSIQTYVMNPKK